MSTAVIGSLLAKAAEHLLKPGAAKAALDLAAGVTAVSIPEIDAVKNVANLLSGIHSHTSNPANGPLGLPQISNLYQAVQKLKPFMDNSKGQWTDLDAIANGLATKAIDLSNKDTRDELQQLQKHLSEIHTDLDQQQTNSSGGSAASTSQELLDNLAGRKFKLSENMVNRDLKSLFTYLMGNPKGFDIARLLELKELHHELQFQGGSDILKTSIEKLGKGGSLSSQEHADLTHLTKHLKEYFDDPNNKNDIIPQAKFAEQQSMSGLVDKASDQIIAMLDREFSNGGSLPAMAMKAMGLNLGEDASNYLKTKIFTSDFKASLFSLIQGNKADTSKLDSTQKTVLSVADWGMWLVKKMPKGAINFLPMVNTVGRMFFIGPLSRIPGFKFLYGPLSLAIDFIGVNAKEMSTLMDAIHDASPEGASAAPPAPTPKKAPRPAPAPTF